MRPDELARLGLTSADLPYLAAWRSYCGRHGISPEPGLQWYSANKDRLDGMDLPTFYKQVDTHLAQSGLSEVDREVVHAWTDTVRVHGVEAIQLSPREQAQLDLDEISALNTEHPDIFDESPELQATQLALIEALQGKGSETPSVEGGVSTDPTSSRLAAISQLRRTDPDRYDRSPDLQREELALIEAQRTGQPARTDTPRTPAQDRLAEFSRMRRSDPDGWDRNRAAQAEELALMSANLGNQVAESPPPSSTPPNQGASIET